jgi:hypothetical protein
MTDFERGRAGGYAEGSDSRLLGCYLAIAKLAEAPDVSAEVRLNRITQGPLKVWRRELQERGLLG